ncbi:hypothetical protein WJX73_003119 [Symbiochloris irregularis]|uniref:Uncharacterized protein n=1 Tax=Symbiochloris irregularis TaxID=706552 RepID=A0AAW1PM72_9CHLO
MVYANPIPVSQWETDLAFSLGQTVSMLRFAIAFFASVPIGAGLRLIKDPKARHIYSVTTGLALVYFPFGNGIVLAVLPSLLTYVAMWRIREYASTLAWLVDFTYLIGCHVTAASGTAWKQGRLDFTGAQMVLTLKLISLASCYQDGLRKDEELTEYQRKMKLERMPSLLEYLSYVFASGNLLAGPNFEMADYLKFIEGRGPWAPNASRPVPSSWQPGLVRLAKAMLCLGIHMSLVPYFSPLTLEADSFYEYSLWRRLLIMYAAGTVARYKYYFAWAISEAGLIMSGFCFNGYAENGASDAKWDRYSNTRIRKVELCTSAAELAAHWNICTGSFLRQYVYVRLTPKGRKPPFRAMLLTQIVSGIWHGLFPGYAMFFVGSAFMFDSAKIIYRYELSSKYPWLRTFVPWLVLKWIYTALCLNFLASAFLLLDFWPSLRVWRSVHFIPLFLMGAVMLTNIVNPPRKPKSGQSKSASSSPTKDASVVSAKERSPDLGKAAAAAAQGSLKAE